MALSDLKLAKLSYEFSLLDSDGNGVLEWSDFERLEARLGELRGLRPGSPERETLLGAFSRYWSTLALGADRNLDWRITREEFLDFYDYAQLVTAGTEVGSLPPWLSTIADGMFRMLDDDGDGVISEDELALLHAIHGIPREQTAAVFPALDRDGNGTLDAAEVRQLVLEFYLGDDPAAPGNLLYGALP